jgi:hypothetical protein
MLVPENLVSVCQENLRPNHVILIENYFDSYFPPVWHTQPELASRIEKEEREEFELKQTFG